jgi:hypothetical protein
VSEKGERREQARLERTAIRRRMQRRRRNRTLLFAGLAFVVAAVIGVLAIAGSPSSPAESSDGLPGLQTGPPPWPPEYAFLPQRLQALGLPAGPSMAANVHHHDLLQVFVHGQAITVPANIGVDQTAGYLTSLHTHDTSGIMHVESPEPRDFTLGEFFDVWGVRLTGDCIGGDCNDGTNQLRAYVNGTPYTGDPRTIPLGQHDDIVLTYGTDAEQPNPIPATYSKTISPTCAPDC